MTITIKTIALIGCVSFSIAHAITPDQTAFLAAINKGDTNTANSILSKPGFTLNFPEAQSSLTMFISGRNIMGKRMATFLINHNINVNFDMDANGNSPLIVAATQGHRNMVFSLLEHGANINKQNSNGLTALMAAIQANANGDMEQKGDHVYDGLATTKLLIDRGANIQLQDNLGKTANDYALRKPEFLKLLEKQVNSATKSIEDFLGQSQTIDYLKSPAGSAYLRKIGVSK